MISERNKSSIASEAIVNSQPKGSADNANEYAERQSKQSKTLASGLNRLLSYGSG